MTNPTLTFAVSHYDRYVPFFDGSVQPTGFELKMLHVGQSEEGRYGQHRHERMLQKGDEAAEAAVEMAQLLRRIGELRK